MSFRRERAFEKLNPTLNKKNSLLRRAAARVIIILVVWLGLSFGTLVVFTLGILLMGGPKLLSGVWISSEPRIVAFAFVSIVVGGLVGGVLGNKLAHGVIVLLKILNQDRIDEL